MTLAIRVIATILVDRNGAMVKGRGFASDRVVGVPLQAARVYANMREIDELVILDVHATADGREPDYALLAAITDSVFIPVAYGGGITSVEQAVRLVKECGVDKVVIGTSALDMETYEMTLLTRIGDRLGSQAVIASVDVRYIGLYGVPDSKKPEPMLLSGRILPGLPAVDYAVFTARAGVGEILLQSIERDGTLAGYDLDLIRAVSAAVSIPVIASGGCSGPADMVAAVRAGAAAVAAGALWQFTDTTPDDCKRAFADAGYTVRQPKALA